MANRMASCRAWHWLRNVGAAGLTFALMVGLCKGQTTGAADFPLLSSPSTNTTTASLEFQETDFSMVNWGVSLTIQTAPFTNEPAAAGKIVRGVLHFSGAATNDIPFVWQRGAGKLFLDLNRNRDFSDDPAGRFSANEGNPNNAQTFKNIRLPLNPAVGKGPTLGDLHFWDYGSRPSCSLAVRSLWQGKVTLQGRDWQVGLVQNNASRANSFSGDELLLRPWEQRKQAFNTYDGSYAAVPFSRNVFVDGRAYQLDIASPAGTAAPALKFTEQSVALGELQITGRFIQRLVLRGGSYLILLDQPAGTVKIPAGTYGPPQVRLEQGGIGVFGDASQSLFGKQIVVAGQKPAVLNIGGPLTNSVSVSRHGADLRLDYRLVGVGGEAYQMAVQNRSQPPEFAVYQAGKNIASGKFEFG